MRSFEQALLAPVHELIEERLAGAGASPRARLDLLEAVVAHECGWDLAAFRAAFAAERSLSVEVALAGGRLVRDLIALTPMPLPLALAALAHPVLDRSEQRRAGAYYTDFRLASLLARDAAPHLIPGSKVLDPASGSGMLLGALVMAATDSVAAASELISNSICAADMSTESLRATRITLAATMPGNADLAPLLKLESRLLSGDSLLRPAYEWERISPGGFGLVIANPPWEKVKVSRHETLVERGVVRHYGADYVFVDDELRMAVNAERRRIASYLEEVSLSATRQGLGDADLYKLFLDLAIRVSAPRGQLALLVPAGLIRSQGTKALREFLVEHADSLEITVHDNRARYFAIDTRFKFLSLNATVTGSRPTTPIRLSYGRGTPSGIDRVDGVEIERDDLRRLRPDLTIPEVRRESGWNLFSRISKRGTPLAGGTWRFEYMREVDMTNDRGSFVANTVPNTMPVLEGRMVHQFRSQAKAYQHGTGRASLWQPLAIGSSYTMAQFHISASDVSDRATPRIERVRAGFCDITGQTNERTLLAAVIPPGVVCGNKVPTLMLEHPGFTETEAVMLWVAIANSVPIDWIARRLVTTSINRFHLAALPFPVTDPSDPRSAALIAAAQEITDAELVGGVMPSAVASIRATIDSIVADLFGLSVDEFAQIFEDFPLLDRGQPRLPGEARSTITRDLALHTHALRTGAPTDGWERRLRAAEELGAVAYVPAEHAGLVREAGMPAQRDLIQSSIFARIAPTAASIGV
ncbi:N-6 DNA methylase [Salinibacterium sp. ZJ454]|uniref:Eco57I restriction-modification methylase domain-containing protein n=1 Tax=Salinibacterium sp. ZJ454 TaxID=2708339 RepID=UPI00141E1E71|nr:N-6 DNA methylase [Salinibacterium sp. ZJ454]